MNIELKELNNDNWLETANLSVSEKQKEIFPIPNVYWIGVSRYEEHTTLYAIMLGETVIGLLGLGYDEDGVSGFINPIMIDEKYQGNHYAENAMTIAIDILKMRESTAQTSTTFEFIEAVLCPFNEFSANESESYTYLVKILSSLYKIPCLSCWNIHPSGTENS